MSWPAPSAVDTLRISTTSGGVHVIAEPGRREISSSTGPVSVASSSPTIEGGSSRVVVRVPEHTSLVIGSTSGGIRVEGRVGAVSAVTRSGRITVAHARSVDARSSSGRIEIGHADGDCRVVSTSGRVDIARCGGADVTSRSGRIVLRDAHGPVRANCTSGRIGLTMSGAYDVAAETVSGRIEASFPDGVRPLVVDSAAETSGDHADHDCVVIARSGSGRISVSGR